jgi:hypothetical protein
VEFIGLLDLWGSGVRGGVLFGVHKIRRSFLGCRDRKVKLGKLCRKSLLRCIVLVQVNNTNFSNLLSPN